MDQAGRPTPLIERLDPFGRKAERSLCVAWVASEPGRGTQLDGLLTCKSHHSNKQKRRMKWIEQIEVVGVDRLLKAGSNCNAPLDFLTDASSLLYWIPKPAAEY